MKKVFFVLAIILSSSSFATPPVDENVSSSFTQAFPHINNAKWYEYENSYEVYFTSNDVVCRLTYDIKGDIISLRRDYYEKDLPLYILLKLKDRYKGKKIFGVTEISSGEGVSYTIVLEDDKHWTTVKADANGTMSRTKKLRKA
jgi:hypothetical protein